jgi:hypothetical protein
MTLRAFCNRCDEPGEITSRKFAGNISVAVTPQPQPDHQSVCEDCLAELLQDAVVSLDSTPTARDYTEMRNRAAEASKAYAAVERVSAENDALKQKLAEARSESTTASRYDGWRGEKAELLSQMEALTQDRNVALAKVAQSEASAADVLKRAQAAATQAQADEKATLNMSRALPPVKPSGRAGGDGRQKAAGRDRAETRRHIRWVRQPERTASRCAGDVLGANDPRFRP